MSRTVVVRYETADGIHRPHARHVLTISDSLVARVVAFHDPGLFPTFGLVPGLHGVDA